MPNATSPMPAGAMPDGPSTLLARGDKEPGQAVQIRLDVLGPPQSRARRIDTSPFSRRRAGPGRSRIPRAVHETPGRRTARAPHRGSRDRFQAVARRAVQRCSSNVGGRSSPGSPGRAPVHTSGEARQHRAHADGRDRGRRSAGGARARRFRTLQPVLRANVMPIRNSMQRHGSLSRPQGSFRKSDDENNTTKFIDGFKDRSVTCCSRRGACPYFMVIVPRPACP